MAQTLPQNLRQQVLAAIEAGASCRTAAAQFGVSASSAVRWQRLMREQGHAIAKPRGGDRRSARMDAHSEFIRQILAIQCDLTLAEIRDRLLQRGAPASIRTVSGLLTRHNIERSRRKRAGSAENRRRRQD